MSYLSRILRLTLLGPDLVEAVLDGRQLATLQLESMLKPFPIEWEAQRKVFLMGGDQGPPNRSTPRR